MNHEKITGITFKNWFINAYIDLEKNKALLKSLAATDVEKTDINNVSYCMKNIVQGLENIPEDADCIWVLDVATQIAKDTANSSTSLHLYQYLIYALKEFKSVLTPVDVIEIVSRLSEKAKEEILNNDEITIADIFVTAKEQCDFLDAVLDIESTCQCLITASQIVLMETQNQYQKVDYKIALACIIFSALEYAWKEKEFTSNVVSEMISNMLKSASTNSDKTKVKECEFEIIYSIETTLENMEKIKKNIGRTGAKSLIVGECGPFDIGNWTILSETKTPLMILPLKTPFKNLRLQTTRPIKLDTYSNITQENSNVISIFEKIKPQVADKPKNDIAIISAVQNLSLLEPISRTNATVVYKPDDSEVIQNIIEVLETEYIVLMPSNEKDMLLMRRAFELSSKNEKIIIAETKNDLEIKYLSEEIAMRPEVIKECTDINSVEKYMKTTLAKQRTLTLRNEYENIDDSIINFIDDSDTRISVLVDAKEVVFLQQRIEQIIYNKNPNIQLEIIVSNSGELVINAH